MESENNGDRFKNKKGSMTSRPGAKKSGFTPQNRYKNSKKGYETEFIPRLN